MPLDVVGVELAGDYHLTLTFEDGDRRIIDICQVVAMTGVFEPLKVPEFFRQVKVDPELGTIVWPNGADLSPEMLHSESRSLLVERTPG
jgi:hypothetical protein